MALVLQKKENFRVGNCNFTPTGDNKLDCLNKCKANPDCVHYQCENICSKCEVDKTICSWDEKEEILDPVKIKVDTSEGSVKISFVTSKKSYEVDGYLYQMYKTNNKSDGIHMGIFPIKIVLLVKR